MARPQNEPWLTCTDIRRTFGITVGKLQRRGVRTRGESPVEYDLDDFWEKFGAEIGGAVKRKSGIPAQSDWQLRKLKAEVLIIEARNRKMAAGLVRADLIEPTFNKCLSAVMDIIDTAPARMLRRMPDIDPSVIAIVEEALQEAREAGAGVDFSAIVKSDRASGDPVSNREMNKQND